MYVPPLPPSAELDPSGPIDTPPPVPLPGGVSARRVSRPIALGVFVMAASVLHVWWSNNVTIAIATIPLLFVLWSISAAAILAAITFFRWAGGWRGRAARPVIAALGTVTGFVLGLIMLLLGLVTAFGATVGFTRGRQIRKLGRVLLPRIEPGDAWAQASTVNGDLGIARPDAPPARDLAARWRENGRTEHASVAAFARLTLDLMALAAPPSLIKAANEDALDEIRHTELCFGLARAIDGEASGPAAFPEARAARTIGLPRTAALARLAVDSLVDGALYEAVSARIVARLAKRCTIAPIREVLKSIAADEGRHAAHGWDVVEWCLAEGGAPVASAIAGAVKALPREMRSPLPEGAARGAWEAWGIHGHALEAEEYEKAREALVRRVERLVARPPSASRRAAA